jgi:hypothetical protein
LVAALVVAMATGGTACGGESDEDEIRALVADTQRAFDAGELRIVCDSLTAAAKHHIVSMGHGEEGRCIYDLRLLHQSIKANRAGGKAVQRQVTRIAIDGDRATATVTYRNTPPAEVPLLKEGDSWKIDALFGGLPAGRQQDRF